MFYKINNINVVNANLLSCPYTSGFSLAAIKGLVDFLKIKLSNFNKEEVMIEGFGLIITSVNPKTKELIQRDTSTSKSTNSNYILPSLLQNRYFDFSFELILKVSDSNDNLMDSQLLANALNLAKVQSGIISNEIKSENISSFYSLNSLDLTKGTYPLSYFITDATNEIDPNKDIIEQLADKLSVQYNPYLLISNGYKFLQKSEYKRDIELQEDTDSVFVEPNISLGKILPVHLFNKDQNILKNFLFSTVQKDGYFIVEAK